METKDVLAKVAKIETTIAEMREQYGSELIAEFLRTDYDGLGVWWVHTPFVDRSCSGLVMDIDEDVARFVVDAYAALPDLCAAVRALTAEVEDLRERLIDAMEEE